MLPSTSRISELIALVQQRMSPFELVYQSHSHWPLPKALRKRDVPHSDNDPDNSQRLGAYKAPRTLRVSILDSSFNPPTRAHLALALARSRPTLRNGVSLPGQYPVSRLQTEQSTTNESAQTQGRSSDRRGEGEEDDYDARLLLLSVRNADKSLKPGDASYVQRVEMMYALARELEGNSLPRAISDRSPTAEPSLTDTIDSNANVAVGIIDEPTFVKKAEVLHSFLHARISPFLSGATTHPAYSDFGSGERNLTVQLTFLMGYDTLERLVAPRYYAPASVPTTATSADPGSQEILTKSDNPERDAQTEAMHAALRRFFFGNDSDAVNGEQFRSIVVCAHRNPSSFTKQSLAAQETSKNTIDAPSTLSTTLMHAQPYIDAGCVTFIDLSAEEAAMSSSEVRKKVRLEAEARELKAHEKGDGGECEGWREMVCRAIAKFIEENRLYAEGS